MAKTTVSFQEESLTVQPETKRAYGKLYNGTGPGAEMTRWLDWPRKFKYSKEYEKLKMVAKKIREDNESVVFIGIGGSYLGIKAYIESQYGAQNYNEESQAPYIYFAGCEINELSLARIAESVMDFNFAVVVISKSGTTTEPAVAFSYFRDLLKEKYGRYYADHVFAITDPERGTLREEAEREGYTTFNIPEGIGGRYSVLTPVGMLPCEISNICTEKILDGAIQASEEFKKSEQNPAAMYAQWRNMQYSNGKRVEILAVNSLDWQSFGAWFGQLFGESEGKDKKGLLPIGLTFSTDLHSYGQFIQDGSQIHCVTQLIVERNECTKFSKMNRAAMDGSFIAHSNAGVPCARIFCEDTLEGLGYISQFFMTACGISGYLIGVNPFDQPGVEAYKKEMKKILTN